MFLWNDGGFMIAVNPLTENAVFPSWFHVGFRLETAAEVKEKYRVMKAADCPIDKDLSEFEDFVFFRARDPGGYIVEIFWEPVPA
jgi:hypothetical protein